jgi:hypothetical protein
VSDVGTPAGETQPVPGAPLFVVKGDATAEEVAALTAVLQGIAAAEVSAPARGPAPEWSAHHRKLRRPHASGPGGWRASSMPH